METTLRSLGREVQCILDNLLLMVGLKGAVRKRKTSQAWHTCLTHNILCCPGGLALSPDPDRNLLRRGLSLDSPPAAKSRKRDVLGFSLGVDKTPHGQGVSKGQDLALGVIPSSQPKRRRCDVFGTNNSKKRH
jgi:hypothetical protein